MCDSARKASWPSVNTSGPYIASARSPSEYSPVLPDCPLILLGFGLFGHGPRARRALSASTCRGAAGAAPNLQKIVGQQISCHSADTFSSPRNKNSRIPRADLIMPNTDLTIYLRAA